ncbi:MAG: hypothetical protein COB98_02655 [Flavobacteriaceae bacterium]|nr:MAG: hypothetical protein COB98_02655 [Flavobacteriaceae bacterium]
MNTTHYTSDIFEILSKGQFICSNSSDAFIRKLYGIIDEAQTFDSLYDYFYNINFILEKGNEYYLFTRKEPKVSLERKIEAAYKWIDIVDFFKTYNNSFVSGFKFTISEIDAQLSTNSDLKSKLEGLKKYTQKNSSHVAIISKIIDLLIKDNFIELQDDISNTYKVLASFNYLEELISTIHIPEEIADEIPE